MGMQHLRNPPSGILNLNPEHYRRQQSTPGHGMSRNSFGCMGEHPHQSRSCKGAAQLAGAMAATPLWESKSSLAIWLI